MEDMLRELIKDQLEADDSEVTSNEILEWMVAEAYCQAEAQDLATILDTIVDIAISAYGTEVRRKSDGR
jgi:hypothetical protein